MFRTYPAKIWRQPATAADPAPVGELARKVDALRLWPLLDAIEGPGFLLADQAGRLLYSDTERATKAASGRLKKLLDLGVIGAFRFSRQDQPERGGSMPLVYCLTKAGAQLLAAHRGIKAADLRWHDETNILSTFHVCHRLDTVDFHVALAHFCEKSGAKLASFKYEPRYPLEKGTLGPDAQADVMTPAGPLSLLVEIDRGTELPKRFAERTAKYEAFYQSGEWERWLHTEPTVLVVATVGAEERVAALREATAKALESCPLFHRYRFTAGEWLYQVGRGKAGYQAPVETRFGQAVTLPPDGSEFKPLIGGGQHEAAAGMDGA